MNVRCHGLFLSSPLARALGPVVQLADGCQAPSPVAGFNLVIVLLTTLDTVAIETFALRETSSIFCHEHIRL